MFLLPQKTDSGCMDFRTGRSKPVAELCKPNVGSAAMISTIEAPAPGPGADKPGEDVGVEDFPPAAHMSAVS